MDEVSSGRRKISVAAPPCSQEKISLIGFWCPHTGVGRGQHLMRLLAPHPAPQSPRWLDTKDPCLQGKALPAGNSLTRRDPDKVPPLPGERWAHAHVGCMLEGHTEVSPRRKAKEGRTDHEKKIGHACLVLNMLACTCCRSVGRHTHGSRSACLPPSIPFCMLLPTHHTPRSACRCRPV